MRRTTILFACIGALALSGCESTPNKAQAQETRPSQSGQSQAQQDEIRRRKEEAARAEQQRQQAQARQEPAKQMPTQQTPATGQAQPPRNLSAAQIAGVLDLANAAEISQAELARERSRSAEVRRFADQMLADHTQAQDSHRRVLSARNIDPQTGELTQRMRRESETTMQSLRMMNAENFDRAYVDAQVREHRNLVGLLDANMPNVQDREYRGYLAQQRTTIEHHRQMAERLQTTLSPRASR